MKIYFLILMLIVSVVRVYSQATLPLRADTVVVEKVGGNANFKLKDVTRDSTGGLYVNMGGGLFRAIKTRRLTDTSYRIGLDTIRFSFGSSPVITADNGLTKTGNNIRLGGTLVVDTDIPNDGFSFFIHGTGQNIFRTVNGSFQANIATSPIAAQLTGANSSSGFFSEVNSEDGQVSINGGQSGTFYNNITVAQAGIDLVTRTNTTPHLFRYDLNGKLIIDSYTGTNFQTVDTSYNSLVIDGSGNVWKRSGSGGGGGSSGVTQVNSGYGLMGGPITTTGTLKLDTTTIDARYRKVFNVLNYGATTDSSSHDDCPAIKAAVQAAYDAGGGIVYFPLGHYTIGCALQHSVNGVDPDAQIVLPLTRDTARHKPRITFEGEALNNWSAELVTTVAKNKSGVILESTILDTGYVFGSSFYNVTGLGGDINWTWWAFKNLDIRVRSKTSGTEINHTMSGINSNTPRSVDFDHVKVTVQSSEGGMLPPYSGTIGVNLPHWNNNANILLNNLNISGYYNGLYASEHMNATELVTFSCHNGIYLPYMIHSGYIAQYTSEGCVNHIYVSNETGMYAGGPMDLHIGNYNVEHFKEIDHWNTYASDITFEDTTAQCKILLDYAHIVISNFGDSYEFNTNAPQRVTIGHTNDRSNYVSNPTYVPFGFGTSTGTNRGFQLQYSTNGTDNLSEFQIYPSTGTNVGLISSLVPRGTGFSSTIKTMFNLFNTNYIADPTNFELFQMVAAGNDYVINSLAGGSASLRPIRFQMGGATALSIQTDKLVTVDTFKVLNVFIRPYTSSTTNDGIKIVGTGGGATFGVQNNDAAGFSGIEYLDNTSTSRVFTGFNNGNGQEFRFNNFTSGGYIRFLTGGTEKFKINNSGGVTFNNAFTFPSTDGSNGDVLTTNGSGSVTWQSPSGTSGTYTPTLTNELNVASSTAYPCQYMRVGNVVTVSGKITIDYTATGDASIGMTLPIASSISNDYECAGASSSGINTGFTVRGDATNNRAQLFINTVSSASYDYFFTFTYQVL